MIVLYLLCVMALIGVMGVSLLDTSSVHLAATKTQVYRQLARYVADSGLEYAVAVMNRELQRNPGPFQDDDPGHPESPYTPGPPPFPIPWLRADPAQEVAGSELTLGPARWMAGPPVVNAGEEIASRYRMMFALAVQPTFDYTTVRQQMDVGIVPQFRIRCRGLVRGEADPITRVGSPNARILLGHSIAYLTVRVRMRRYDLNRCLAPMIERVCYDLDPGNPPIGPAYTDH